MNSLIQREIKMTSLELAEVTGKEHNHIMRDIRNEIASLGDEVGQSIFGQSSYMNLQNKRQPCYEFGREGAMQLALKYDALTRRKVIVKLEELEREKMPTGQNLLALAVIEAQKMLEEKDKLLLEQKPKVEFFDSVANSKSALPMDRVAKVLDIKGIGRNKLFEILRDNNILDRDNVPYQTFVDRGYFRVIEQKYTVPNGETKISIKTLVYQKGVDYIRKLIA